MKSALISAGIAAATLLATAAPTVAQAAWMRSYVVEWNEPAFYYGAKAGIIDPGTDCPKGTDPEINWVHELTAAGYTEAEAKWLRDPANPTRSPVNGQNQMAFRGKDRANVYIHPESTADQGLVGVSGTIAEGLNLDGDAKTGFTSPTGETGIDNNFYKALGCWKTYRGPQRLSSGALQFNQSMREGSWTTVIVVTGQGKDPMNDSHVTVGFYPSSDKLVMDGSGNIAADYSFRIKPDAKLEAVFKAKTVKGQITSTEAMNEVWLRNPGYDRELQLLKARVSLQMQPDGKLKGYVGGYRPWLPVYQGWVNARGPVIEALTWVRLPDVYYALKRAADYSPTGPKGEKTHISYALRVEAVPAFVMTPEATDQVITVASYKEQAPKVVLAANAPPPSAIGSIVDGLALPRGAKPVSQTPDQMRPPAGHLSP